MTEAQPMDLSQLCYSTAEDRQALAALICEQGIVGPDDLLVTTGGSGLDLAIASGEAYVLGTQDPVDQGMYRVPNRGAAVLDGLSTYGVQTADGTDPRIDMVVATVRDSDYGGGDDDWILQVIEGTPTAGATLSNLNGIGTIPDNSLLLAYVLVPATFVGPFVNATHILDARLPYGSCGAGALMLVYTSNGTFEKGDYPWAKTARVRAVGGGGGGSNAGTTDAGEIWVSGGGGGGEYAESMLDLTDLADTETVTVGDGGSNGTTGSTGGQSSLGTHVIAKGGAGGEVGSDVAPPRFGGVGGIGGTGGTGQIKIPGQNGGPGFGLAATSVVAGPGGDSQMGRGGRFGNSTAGFNGTDGKLYGGGGSSGANGESQGSVKAGGDGAKGVVIIELFG